MLQQLLHRRLAHPEPPIGQTVVISPGLGQIELPKGVPQKPNVIGGGLDDGLAPWRIWRSPGVLHVKGFAAEATESNKMMEHLPGHAAKGILAHEPQDYDTIHVDDRLCAGSVSGHWARYNRLNQPSRSSSSWNVPCSTTLPSCMTRMRCALFTVESRWAMMNVVF